MPDKPLWLGRLASAVEELQELPSPWIDSATLEWLLHISRRRAQQLLKPLVSQTIGKSGLAAKENVIAHLQRLQTGNAYEWEQARRQKLHALLDELHRHKRATPVVEFSDPVEVLSQTLKGLPAGVKLEPGRIIIEDFAAPAEVYEKLFRLAQAIQNDETGFERMVIPGVARR
jgi:hypothetical protein